jgi:hypothetical protein
MLWEAKVSGSSLVAREIAPEVSLRVFDNGIDKGYHSYSNAWWSNVRCPYAFQYPSIDSMYEQSYYNDPVTSHPNDAIAHDLYRYMQETYTFLFGRAFTSILELGTGGGEISRQFWTNGIDLTAVEGTTEGVERLKVIGLPPDRIVHANLKFMERLDRRFDLVMCTEVAEHVEPWFASRIAENCTRHADAVWFSAADRNRPPHYHHINEVDITAWDNLFAHMGFPIAVELDGRHDRAHRFYLSQELRHLVKPDMANENE